MTLGFNRYLSIAAALAVIVLGPVLVGSGFMAVVPALLMLLPLLGGRYIGERAVHRARRAIAPLRVHLAKSVPATVIDAGRGVIVRGGRLIAASLATRPPPASA